MLPNSNQFLNWMSNINSDPRFLKELLGNNLVLIPGDRPVERTSKEVKDEALATPPPPAHPVPTMPQYGKFAKRVLLLTAHDSADFPNPVEKSFLDKFLPAIHYTWADVKLVNVSAILQVPELFQRFLDAEGYLLLIAFLPKESKALRMLELPNYKGIKRAGKWHLIADTIKDLEADEQKTLKRKLWQSMQALISEIA
jgi:hypothetical protein